MSSLETIKSQIERLPEKTGVYIFKGDEIPLYIGKAENIKSRVKNHLQMLKTDPRERKIIEFTKKVDYIITDSETEALIEENILVKTYKPKYNIRLSDDKTYPYLKIDFTVDYPCLNIVRRVSKGDAKFFGPYADVGAMRKSLKLIRKIFPVRTCRRNLKKYQMRPCLYHHIGQCSAPCANLISKEEYNKIIKRLILFLEGRRSEVINNLKKEMGDASLKQDYEKAAVFRNQINDLEKTLRQVKIVLPSNQNLDAISLLRSDLGVCVHILQVREGKIISSESFDLKSARDTRDQEAIESFIKQYYLRRTYLPDKIIVNKRISDSKVISDWLSQRSGRRVEIKRPLDKKLKRILDVAIENANTHLEQLEQERRRTSYSLEMLKVDLDLEETPRLIECFDISNLKEKESVGSKIVFLNGVPYKKGYRMYRIKTIFKQNDPAMMGEVIERRVKRLLEDSEHFPNLILVDGGITQVKAAKMKLDALGLEIPIIGLAKGEEQIYFSDGRILNLNKRSKSSLLLQQIRDEAHRFAIQYHRKRREKMTAS